MDGVRQDGHSSEPLHHGRYGGVQHGGLLNDWFTALIYLRADQAPLPLVLRNILIKSSTSASQSSMVAGGFAELNKLTEMIKFASIIVAAAPMLIVYPFVQKYFEKGFMAGAVKG